ncbi:unnamed protein product [Pleuronectes platessa]|uniref:Uncharacterized protein n=2 Tax=Pleuronectes platessa TaxID=8262 RepID=A0A9N7TWU6_PLEPL|nr:unnamed protein product [Pleuronectes platessa]
MPPLSPVTDKASTGTQPAATAPPAVSKLPAEVAPEALPATVTSECKVDNAAVAPVADPAPETALSVVSETGATESKSTKEG